MANGRAGMVELAKSSSRTGGKVSFLNRFRPTNYALQASPKLCNKSG